MRRTGRLPKWMRFSLEFHHAGGNCWVLEEGLARQYRFHDNAEFVRDGRAVELVRYVRA